VYLREIASDFKEGAAGSRLPIKKTVFIPKDIASGAHRISAIFYVVPAEDPLEVLRDVRTL